MSSIHQQIRALADRVAASHGLDVVDIEFQGGGGKHRTLRIFLERNRAGRAVLEQRLAGLRDSNTVTAAEKPAEDQDNGDEAEQTKGLTAADTPGEESEPADEFTLHSNSDSGLEDEDAETSEEDGDPGSDEAEEPGAPIELDMVDAGEVAGLSPEEDELAYLREVPAGIPVAQLSGITHGDCERFSRDFGTALDVEDLVPGAEYLLEASSPGLDRKLTTPEEFDRFVGMLCKVQLFTPIAGNRHWQGHLGQVAGDTVMLLPLTPKGGKKKKTAAGTDAGAGVEITFSNIEKAQLVPEF